MGYCCLCGRNIWLSALPAELLDYLCVYSVACLVDIFNVPPQMPASLDFGAGRWHLRRANKNVSIALNK